jgi:hypothetical protein
MDHVGDAKPARTTMNIYTQAVPDAMREANGKVVEMVLPRRKVG